MVAQVLADAREPWWVIAGAAVALHGAAVTARDVDVLLGMADADRLAARLALPAVPGGDDPLFRSARFFVWTQPPLAVEFMAGFAVLTGGAWRPVRPRTRLAIAVAGCTVFVPEAGELRAMLRSFGRAEDIARARLLRP